MTTVHIGCARQLHSHGGCYQVNWLVPVQKCVSKHIRIFICSRLVNAIQHRGSSHQQMLCVRGIAREQTIPTWMMFPRFGQVGDTRVRTQEDICWVEGAVQELLLRVMEVNATEGRL